ncbi:MAG TPA: choice-of-anchor Q domain-containing protein [Candidatus Eisenbacteria bacterium]|nr:choice-of-anchor Q domain-containing protein [Candidatus Eisenbacteria bacterium]
MFRSRFALAALVLFLATPSWAATLTVINLNDNAAGSLRQAIQDSAPGDTIRFNAGLTGTITLAGTFMQITHDLTIIGPGSSLLTIDGNNASGIFGINGAVEMTDVRIAHGNAGQGGALSNSGNLRLERCRFESNHAQVGGAIWSQGPLDAVDCSFSYNVGFSSIQAGGGILSNSQTDLTRCAFYGNNNSAIVSGGSLLLESCTVDSNVTTGNGGGIQTVSAGGGAVIRNSTITRNSASGNGGGIYASGTVVQVRNSIVAGNSGTIGPDVYGDFTSLGYDFIGKNNGSTGFGLAGSHDQVGTIPAPIDPGLGPMADYGGFTWTRAPLIGSLVIDQGSSDGTILDQRGRARPVDDPWITNAVGGDGSEIGAYELSPATITVTNLNDSGAGSLRAAVASVSKYDVDRIVFAPGLAGTIALTTGQISVARPCSIVGPGARLLSVSGNNASRIFSMGASEASLSGITLTHGRFPWGAALENYGKLTMRDCAVLANVAPPNDFVAPVGGGVMTYTPLIMDGCTVAGDSALEGSGVYVFPNAPTTLRNCTVSGNIGIGISVTGATLTLRNCTVTGNSSQFPSLGGGISLENNAQADLGSTIVANNVGTIPDLNGPFTSSGYNLIGKSDGSTGFTNGVNHDQVGTTGAPVNPMLLPLANNGGWTDTQALLVGSPAIDRGSSALATDERGATRYDDPGVVNVGDGSDIGAFERNPNTTVDAGPPSAAPSRLALAAPRPNPARGRASLDFTLPAGSLVDLAVFDLRGRRVRSLASGWQEAGPHAATWDLQDASGQTVTSGIYFVVLRAGRERESRSIVVLQ